jgi:predicted glycoside hydrolase/deacetylase ChbG (UPF0249 family)
MGDSCDGRVAFHADDFGMNTAVTDGILQGFEQGLLTSSSVLAGAPDAGRALGRWERLEQDRRKENLPSSGVRRRLDDPDRPFDLGVHLNLTQGRPLQADRFPRELLDAQGRFVDIFRLFGRLRHGGTRFARAIEDEFTSQIQFVLDHGCRPTHLNGHQYVEMIPVVGPIVGGLLEKFRIPAVRVAFERSWLAAGLWPRIRTLKWVMAGVQTLYARRFRSRIAGLGVSYPDAYFGTMTAGRVDFQMLRAFLEGSGRFRVAEIALHPAQPAKAAQSDSADGWYDVLAEERPKELRRFLSSGLAEYLAEKQLRLGRVGG